MNHDYDDELGRGAERRSRRNPRMRDGGSNIQPRSEKEKWESRRQQPYRDVDDELDVLGDPSVHPIPKVRDNFNADTFDPDRYDSNSFEPKRPVGRTAADRAAGSRVGADRVPGSRQSADRVTGNRPGADRAAGSRPGVDRMLGNRQSTDRAVTDRKSAARQTAAGGGIPPRREAENARKKSRRRMITMIIAECFALLFIFGYGFMARTMAKVQRPDDFVIEDIPTNDIDVSAVETMKGYWTIAIFGVDARDNAIRKSTNADVNMICNINLDTGEIKLVSVYRDSYLNISENGSYNKINQAYFMGGADQAVAALNRNLDLKINDFVTFNWKGVAQAIDILGGVDIELSKAEFYYINSFITETVKATGIGSHQLTHAGMNHLDGVQAVAYGRLRLMDTDYARTERQRKVIQLAFEKAKKADFQTLYTLIGTVFPNVYTSLWVDDLVNNARNINKFYLSETTGFPNQRGDANMGKKGAVVVPATLESNVIRLHEFLFGDPNYTPSETVKNISAKISADTKVYKEGQVIDNVGTGGGVIQTPKTTAAERDSTKKSNEDEGYQYVYETDADGKKVKRKVKMETDEDGDYIEIETDEDGFRVDEPTKATVATRPTDVVETDEFGDVIETTGQITRPGDPAESSATRPTGDGTRPTGDATRPTSSGTRPTTPDSTTAARPGETTSGNTGPSGRPDTTTSPSSGTVSRPGETIDSNGASRPTASGGPAETTSASEISQFPGGNTSGTASQQGPGGNGNPSPTPTPTPTPTTAPTAGAAPGGTVAAPGL